MGVEPPNYQVFEVDIISDLPQGANENGSSLTYESSWGELSYENATPLESATWSRMISNLETSTEYYVRVSAKEKGVGYGKPAEARSNPVAPRGVPEQLGVVHISRVDATTLNLDVEQRVNANGADVKGYMIEWGTYPQFSDALTTTVEPDYRIQALRLNTWRRGWATESEFSLSLFNFRGTFDSRLGGEDSNGLPTFVSIVKGTNTLHRIAPNVTAGFGAAALYKAVPRGGFVSVGGQEFRVCLDKDMPYDVDVLSLCSVIDPYIPEPLAGVASKYDNTLTRVPAYIMDTAIGSAFRLAVGDTALKTYDGPDTNISVNDLTSTLAPGDHIRVGHPEMGRVFTVCKADATTNRDFNATSLPLCSGNDPEEVVSVMEGDIMSATYEIQQFGVWLQSASIDSDILEFRIAFGDERSATSEKGGDPGCLSFFSSASEVRPVDSDNLDKLS